MHDKIERQKDSKRILNKARSPYKYYCEGFGNNDTGGCYVATPIITAGMTRHIGPRDRPLILEQIQAFDTAEAEGAYIGQINLSQISSFCGLNGVIWGHDVANCSQRLRELPASFCGSSRVPVYELDPLLAASKRLLGTATQRRFPIIPGSMVPAAYKSLSEIGPMSLYGGLAIGVPADDRTCAALFMEYVGSTQLASTEHQVEKERERIGVELLESVLEVGANHDIEFGRVYVGTRALSVANERLGCILVVVPYLALAKDSWPDTLVDRVDGLTIDEWEASVSDHFYCNRSS